MKIPVNESAWAAKDIAPISAGKIEGLGFLKAGDKYRFVLPGRSEVIDVQIVNNNELDLQPERSAAHKALLAFIG